MTRMGSLSRVSLSRERVWIVCCHLITLSDQGLITITAIASIFKMIIYPFSIFNFTSIFQKINCSCHKRTGWFLRDLNLFCSGFHIKWNFRGAWPLSSTQKAWQLFTFKFSLLSQVSLVMKCNMVMKSLHFQTFPVVSWKYISTRLLQYK